MRSIDYCRTDPSITVQSVHSPQIGQYMNKPAQIYPTFYWLRSQRIESLNIVVEEYRHKKTGAPHYHLVADNAENVFRWNL